MPNLYRFARPVLQALDPERAHGLTVKALKWGFGPRYDRDDPENLSIDVFGLRFPNPIGLAAGFDKNAEVPQAMLQMGLGFTEVGTVTPRPQPGNPKPRLYRLVEDRAVINRMGFNNQGLDAVASRLKELPANRGIVGANVGANKDSEDRVQDYVLGLRRLWTYADYFTVNVSSPNTPGLRGLQDKESLDELLKEVHAARQSCRQESGVTRPVLLKVAPDLEDGAIEDIAALVKQHQIDGLIVSNTTIGLRDKLKSHLASESGGLSGEPLFALSTEILAKFFQATNGNIPLVGVGGIASADDAYRKIKAGASLLQVYSALTYQGPDLIERLKQGLSDALARDGYRQLSDAVGIDHA